MVNGELLKKKIQIIIQAREAVELLSSLLYSNSIKEIIIIINIHNYSQLVVNNLFYLLAMLSTYVL